MKKIYIKFLQLLFIIAVLLFAEEIKAQRHEVEDSVRIEKDKTIMLGYGQQTSNLLIESVGTIKSDELMKSSVNTIGNSLFGRISGLIVTKTNTDPWNDAPQLLIRGRSTYNNASPLILIDGFEADFSRMSLSEIESISVLKDAAATAIYGLKGANGVILVTTKRGSKGKIRFDINIEGGFSSLQNMPDLLNSHDYTSMYNKALTMDGQAPLYKPDMYPGGATPGDPVLYPDNIWANQVIKSTAPTYNAGIQISGGSTGLKYYVNFNYLRNEGHYKYSKINEGYSTQNQFDRVNVRTNLDIDLIEKLALDVDLGMRFENQNSPGTTTDGIWNSIYQTPPMLYNMVNPDGTPGGTTDYRNNPYALITAAGYQGNHTRDVNATIRARYDFTSITKGLTAGAAFSVFDQSYTIDNKLKQYAVYSINNDYEYSKYGDNTNLEWQSGSSYYRRNNYEADLSYKRKFGEHSFDAISIFRMTRLIRQSTHHKVSQLGISGRLNYGFKDRYLAEFTYAYQGSEVFHPDNQFGFFPAGAIGWVISKESFFAENLPFVSFFKVRGSYGVSGSDMFVTGTGVVDRIFYNQYYGGLAGYNFGVDASTTKGGYGELRLANPLLTWEKSYKTDISAELALFSKVELGFTYFRDHRKDLFTLDANAPALIGINNDRLPYTNNGEVLNKGFESSFRYSDQSADFSWSVGILFDHNRSEILKKGDEPFYQETNRVRIGNPIGQIFGMVSTGLYDGTSTYIPHVWGELQEGDLVYADVNGDEIVDDRDIASMGYSSIPEYVFSLDLNVKYKNFDLSILAQGVDNVSTMLGGQFIPFRSKMNAYQNVFDSWTPETKATATLPRLTTLNSLNNHRASTVWLESTRFIKLRNVEFGYNFSDKLLKSMKVEKARIFISGMNLLTWNNTFNFLDPESMGGYPSLSSFHAGLRVSF